MSEERTFEWFSKQVGVLLTWLRINNKGQVMWIKKGLAMVDVRTLGHFTSAVSSRCPSPNGDCFDRSELHPPFCCDLCRILRGD